MTSTPLLQPPRRIWLALEGPDIIELKQVMQDHDVAGADDFFRRVVAPRVREAAGRRGIPINGAEEDGSDGRLPG